MNKLIIIINKIKMKMNIQIFTHKETVKLNKLNKIKKINGLNNLKIVLPICIKNMMFNLL
jgi:hypothetical protein